MREVALFSSFIVNHSLKSDQWRPNVTPKWENYNLCPFVTQIYCTSSDWEHSIWTNFYFYILLLYCFCVLFKAPFHVLWTRGWVNDDIFYFRLNHLHYTQIKYPSQLSCKWSAWVQSYKFPVLLHQAHLLDRAMEMQWQWKCMLGHWAFSGGNMADWRRVMLAEDGSTSPEGVGHCNLYIPLPPSYPIMHSTHPPLLHVPLSTEQLIKCQRNEK